MAIIIDDRRNFSLLKNLSLTNLKAILPVIKDYYPERIYRIYIVNAEFLLNVALKLVSPLLS